MKVLFDMTDTCHSRQQSGIPQVARNLHAHFPGPREVVIFDRYSAGWRAADARERRWLDPRHHLADEGARVRNWSGWQRLRGRWRKRWGIRHPRLFGPAAALVAPELFYPASGRRFGALRSACGGPVVAIFHDAVALRHPEFAPPAVVANFPDYMAELRQFDAVTAVSEASRSELLAYWDSKGWRDNPPVTVIPLGTHLRPAGSGAPAPASGGEPPLVLFVSTIEPRKNHAVVLAVASRLWRAGCRFRLALAGGCIAETRAAWAATLAAFDAPAGCFTYHGRVPQERLHALYDEAAFTVYPSFWEGFGLPVLESLSHGKPCICSGRGGLAEVTAGGGCVLIEPEDEDGLARAWRGLLEDPALHQRLAGEARARRFRGWADYARDLEAWLGTVAKRPASGPAGDLGGAAPE